MSKMKYNLEPGGRAIVNNNENPNHGPPDLMTEAELVEYLRIPEVSAANNPRNVIDNLKRAKNLPCIHISNKCLYPRDAVRDWIMQQIKI